MLPAPAAAKLALVLHCARAWAAWLGQAYGYQVLVSRVTLRLIWLCRANTLVVRVWATSTQARPAAITSHLGWASTKRLRRIGFSSREKDRKDRMTVSASANAICSGV